MPDFEAFGAAESKGWAEPETAKSYASGFATAAEMCVPKMVELARARPGTDMLDVCCGHGNVTRGLVAAGARATGLDFSPAMLSLARENVPDARFVQGDATRLPFDENRFDAVTMGFGILHVPDSEAAIAEVFRVLKPGGRFVYSNWHGPDVSPVMGFVFGSIQALGDPSVEMPPAPPLEAYANADFAFPVLENAGFKDLDLATVDSLWRAEDPGLPYDHFFQGTVRGALLLRAQPEQNAQAIRAAIVDKVREAFGAEGPWEIPIPAALVSATKP